MCSKNKGKKNKSQQHMMSCKGCPFPSPFCLLKLWGGWLCGSGGGKGKRSVKEEKERPGGTLDREKQHGQHCLLLREEEEGLCGCVSVFVFLSFCFLSRTCALSLSLSLSLSRSVFFTYSCKILSA